MVKIFIKKFLQDIQKRGYYIDLLLKFLNIFPGESGNLLRGCLLGKIMKSAGVNTQINSGSIIFNPKNMVIGDNFFMNSHCLVNATAGLICGNNVLIGPGVKIWTINHEFNNIEIPINQQGWSKDCIIIGNDVWLGANVIVLPGVTIPDGVVIGALSLITKKTIFEPYCLYAGNPIRKIRKRA